MFSQLLKDPRHHRPVNESVNQTDAGYTVNVLGQRKCGKKLTGRGGCPGDMKIGKLDDSVSDAHRKFQIHSRSVSILKFMPANNLETGQQISPISCGP